MALANLTFTFELTSNDSDDNGRTDIVVFSKIDLVYPVYAMVWIWSIYVQFFEYKRGLPHSWYCH